MKYKIFNLKYICMILIIGFVLFTSNVTSLAVTSICSDLTPCYMNPGEEKTYDFILQSSPGDGNIIIKFEILDDFGGIAQIVGDNEFNVNSGESINAKLKVKIPQDSADGNIVKIVLKFTQVPNNQGQVSLSPSFTMYFPVSVVNGLASKNVISNEKSGNPLFFILVAVILVFFVLMAITTLIIKNKKKQIA